MAEISIGDAIKAFLKKSRLKTGIQALQIEQVWETIMGKTIAKYTICEVALGGMRMEWNNTNRSERAA